MTPKIFYRERLKVGKGEKKPRFRIVAVNGVDLRIYADHLRKKEVETIAKEVGADLIQLEAEPSKNGGGKD